MNKSGKQRDIATALLPVFFVCCCVIGYTLFTKNKHKYSVMEQAQHCLILLNIACAGYEIDCDKHPAVLECLKDLEKLKNE